MEQDLFKYLPPEIIIDILSRLPVRTIAMSKCVRKSWLDLLKNDEFVKFYLSRSAAALAYLVPEKKSSRCTVFDLEDEIDAESSHDHHYNHLTNFDFPHSVTIEGSANGLLFLRKYEVDYHAFYVCNPISREYIELHCPQEFFFPQEPVIYGFGASKLTGQHKVVLIIPRFDCYVYTLGTGWWRRVEAPSGHFSFDYIYAAVVNSNLHWVVRDLSNDTLLILCFDLEIECFSTFSEIPLQTYIKLSVLRDCLCLCDNTKEDVIVIWLMKEYGDEKSWTKEYVMNLTPPDFYSYVYPIKVFKDGDILVVLNEQSLAYFCKKKKTFHEIGVFDEGHGYICSMLLTPSVLSLKSFPMEDVISL